MTRWVGIDEAGYGPNLGPMVMTAVVAEGPGDLPPDLWADLAGTVTRAGGREDRLWVDDSKRVYRGGQGLDRLEAATFALLDAAGAGLPVSLGGLLGLLTGSGHSEGSPLPCGLERWADGLDPPLPSPDTRARVAEGLVSHPFEGAAWRITRVRSQVIDPTSFNRMLDGHGSKSGVSFEALGGLLDDLWDQAGDGVPTIVRADKHGGRHFYHEALVGRFPDAWIDRGPEGPALSRYTIRGPSRRLEVSLQPRADADDGLVALASMVSKGVRERWMRVFNAYWTARLAGLRPTAGYPGDASRFRAAIEPSCRALGLDPGQWWRAR